MINYLKIGVLLFFINANIIGNYYRHKQVCSGIHAIDREWQLNIKPDGTFTYTIKSINTKALKKESTDKFYGTWQSINDTLKLHESKERKDLIFLLRNNKIIPLEQKPDTLNGFIISLDYLEKSEAVKS